jgi:hypothetical protein
VLRAGRFVSVAFMVGLALAIAASCNLPVLVMSIFWKGLTTRGAMIGGFLGLISAVVGVILSPAVWGDAGQGVGAGPARQPGTVLDYDRIRRHLAVIDSGPQRAGLGRSWRFRRAICALPDRHRCGWCHRALKPGLEKKLLPPGASTLGGI